MGSVETVSLLTCYSLIHDPTASSPSLRKSNLALRVLSLLHSPVDGHAAISPSSSLVTGIADDAGPTGIKGHEVSHGALKGLSQQSQRTPLLGYASLRFRWVYG